MVGVEADWVLLRRYAEEGDASAFEAVVQRHVGMVYAAALRQVRDGHAAEDVTQAVFLILAKKAGRMRAGTAVGAWLMLATRYAALDAVRSRMAQARRERAAAREEAAGSAEPPEQAEIAGVLDAALAELSAGDRAAIVGRFFEERSFRELAGVLRTSEEGARKRVSRALGRLRKHMAARGVTVAAGVLIATLPSYGAQAMPPAVLGTVAGAVTSMVAGGTAGAAGASAAAGAWSIAKGAMAMMAWANMKKVMAGVLAMAVAGTMGYLAVESPGLLGRRLMAAEAGVNADLILNVAEQTEKREVKVAGMIGGSGMDMANAVTVDAKGNIYVAGVTNSDDFLAGSEVKVEGNVGGKHDVFVVKLDATGERILAAWRFGGSEDDLANAVAVDGEGNVLVGGETKSADFASDMRLAGGKPVNQGASAFVTKLNAEGKVQRTVTVGGGAATSVTKVLVDGKGQVVVGGTAREQAWMNDNGFDNRMNNSDNGWVMVLDKGLEKVTYATRLAADAGWAPDVQVTDMVLAGDGVLLVGGSGMPGMKTTADVVRGKTDRTTGYVAQIKYGEKGGASLGWLTYVPVAGSRVSGVAALKGGGVAVTGPVFMAPGALFPTVIPGPQAQRSRGNGAYVVVLDAKGEAVRSASAIGGTSLDAGQRVLARAEGGYDLVGTALSVDFPMVEGVQEGFGGKNANGMPGGDGFVMGVDANGAVVFSSLVGGRGGEQVNDATRTAAGGVVMVGTTWDAGLAKAAKTVGGRKGGSADGFVVVVGTAEK